jgi:hypothetical protein|tara:strand:- start:244 stop:681 length:438 start_codon:yes stop_codon:yes gene_type:complete
MLKQGREVKTQVSKLFRTSYGTVDVSSLKSLFINLSTWAEPNEDHENWNRRVKKFKSRIKTTVHGNIKSSMFKDISIIDLDLRASGIRKGKRSFIRCEITLFLQPKQKIDMKSIELSEPIHQITNKVIEESFLTSKIFKFHSSKK